MSELTRTSVTDMATVMSAWFPLPVLIGSSPTTRSATLPLEAAAAPFASGVPTVSRGEVCAGGLHEPNDSGAACVRFGLVQGVKAGTRDANRGVAPLTRG